MSTASTIPAPGFADPTRDAQRAFRAVLDALSHPARRYTLRGPEAAPSALGPGLGAIALTLLDEDASVWLGAPLAGDAEVAAWLAFHTGVRVASEPGSADFVFAPAAARPRLDTLRLGTEDEPHRSATVVLDVTGCDGATRFEAEGPGIPGRSRVEAPWADERFADEWMHNRGLYPRGVDLILVDAAGVTALPRTTRLHPITDEEA